MRCRGSGRRKIRSQPCGMRAAGRSGPFRREAKSLVHYRQYWSLQTRLPTSPSGKSPNEIGKNFPLGLRMHAARLRRPKRHERVEIDRTGKYLPQRHAGEKGKTREFMGKGSNPLFLRAFHYRPSVSDPSETRRIGPSAEDNPAKSPTGKARSISTFSDSDVAGCAMSIRSRAASATISARPSPIWHWAASPSASIAHSACAPPEGDTKESRPAISTGTICP